jgi:flagellar biosynthesis/type III secretory pathway protein FliH
MSEPERRLQLGDIAALLKRDGAFKEATDYAPAGDGSFVPWNKAKFRPVESDRAEPSAEPDTTPAEAPAEEAEASPAESRENEPAPPSPAPRHEGPSAAEIVEAIEKAREEGRVRGHHEGLEAARQELQDAVAALRRLEAGLLEAAAEAAENNAAVIARHVRRIARDLAGSMIADMPQPFLERIRAAADLFTRSGTEFTLALNAADHAVLSEALKDDRIFASIRVIEDEDLPTGAYRLLSRDLEYGDAPQLEGDEA